MYFLIKSIMIERKATMSEKYLKERVAIVTGGASGMGRAMAIAFASKGADVVIGSLLAKHEKEANDGEVVYLPDTSVLLKTKEEIEALDVKCIAVDLDVCSTESCDNFYNVTMGAFGKVDILANSAGITAENPVCGHPEDLWLKVMDVCANGPFRTIKLVLPGMIDRKWGRIINIASTAASIGAPNSAAYCAAKAAVLGLTRCVALEGAEHGVSCNAISPGWVQTDFQKKWMTGIADTNAEQTGEEYIADTIADTPQKRMVQPIEIGALAAYLCMDEAFGITGQDITVSAGSLW
jgi:NAD(P)-dependent dehydrogenase (short-subunit alcohol dehydrogenase family)